MGRADGHTKTLPLPISAVKQSRQSVHRNVVHHTGGKPTRRLFRFPRQDQRIGSAKFDVHHACLPRYLGVQQHLGAHFFDCTRR